MCNDTETTPRVYTYKQIFRLTLLISWIPGLCSPLPSSSSIHACTYSHSVFLQAVSLLVFDLPTNPWRYEYEISKTVVHLPASYDTYLTPIQICLLDCIQNNDKISNRTSFSVFYEPFSGFWWAFISLGLLLASCDLKSIGKRFLYCKFRKYSLACQFKWGGLNVCISCVHLWRSVLKMCVHSNSEEDCSTTR